MQETPEGKSTEVRQVGTTSCPYPGENACTGRPLKALRFLRTCLRWVDLLVTSTEPYEAQ